MTSTTHIFRHWWCAVCIIMAMLAVSCSDDVEQDTDTPLSHDDAPHWTFTPNRDDYQSMTLIARLPDNLAATASDDDEMAVMAGDELVAVAQRSNRGGAVVYFALITAPSATAPRTLRVCYYSAVQKHIFTDDSIGMFVADGMMGTITSPYTLNLNP